VLSVDVAPIEVNEGNKEDCFWFDIFKKNPFVCFLSLDIELAIVDNLRTSYLDGRECETFLLLESILRLLGHDIHRPCKVLD